MTTIADALTALGIGARALKDLNDVDREFDKATLKLRVVELADALTTARFALADAETQLREKSREIEKLHEAFRQKEELVEYHGYHYRRRSTGKPQGLPFCSRCLQDGRLFMTAQSMKGLSCPNCKAEYGSRPTLFTFEGDA